MGDWIGENEELFRNIGQVLVPVIKTLSSIILNVLVSRFRLIGKVISVTVIPLLNGVKDAFFYAVD